MKKSFELKYETLDDGRNKITTKGNNMTTHEVVGVLTIFLQRYINTELARFDNENKEVDSNAKRRKNKV